MPPPMPAETKAAIMAALLEGQAVVKVAEIFKMNKGSISRINTELKTKRLQAVATKKEKLQANTQLESDVQLEPNTQPLPSSEKPDLEELIFEYVSTNLQTLKNQSSVFGRAEYIEKQSASEMAVLHGVVADKTFRILSALEPIINAQSSTDTTT